MAEMEIRAQGVVLVVGDYHDEVEASLQFACPGRDPLGEFFRGDITLRQLRVLVEHLPADSPAVRARRGHDWTTTDYLLWDIDAQSRILNTTLQNMFRDKGVPARQVELLPTPTEPESVEDAVAAEAERQYQERLKSEMDETVNRIFVNPN